MRRVILLTAGFAALALGLLGVLLPVLPTTPFVLLAAGCFSRTSPRFHAWLRRSRVFGQYIDHYETKQGISQRHRYGAITFLWTGLAISALLVRSGPLTLLLAAVGVAVTAHLVSIPRRSTPATHNGRSTVYPRRSRRADL